MNDSRVSATFLFVVEAQTAGSPTDASIKWTHLTQQQISDEMKAKGVRASRFVVKQLLLAHGYKKRKMHKSNCLRAVAGRQAQFKKIDSAKAAFLEHGLPVLSIDSKKKEMLGNFYRPGANYSTGTVRVNDHDFKSFASGQVVPHGIYDLRQNTGYLTLGQSHDTSEFVCENIAHFWCQELQWQYPEAHTMLLLCDGGGSNNCRHFIVKEDLFKLANKLQINILVAHYPPYCSKWNPIEHRLFCHLTHAWQGVTFQNIQIVKELAAQTSTSTGLNVKVRINSKKYSIKRPLDANFKANLYQFIAFDEQLPQWNYLIKHDQS